MMVSCASLSAASLMLISAYPVECRDAFSEAGGLAKLTSFLVNLVSQHFLC